MTDYVRSLHASLFSTVHLKITLLNRPQMCQEGSLTSRKALEVGLFFTDLAISVYVIRMWHSRFVYSVPGHMVNASELLCGIYIGILLPLMDIK